MDSTEQVHQKSELQHGMQRLRELAKLRRAALSRKRRAAPESPPRYDDVYFNGLAWLNNLAYTDNWDTNEE